MTLTRQLNIENAKIVLRNFSGKPDRFTPAGRRKFHVLLNDEQARQLEADGWNIKWFTPKDPTEAPQAHMEVAVAFENVPPKIVMITSGNKTPLGEGNVGILDVAEIENVDLIIRPYNWEVNGKKGVKAYVKAMYVTIAEDDFAKKYRDIPDQTPFNVD